MVVWIVVATTLAFLVETLGIVAQLIVTKTRRAVYNPPIVVKDARIRSRGTVFTRQVIGIPILCSL